MTFTMNTKLKCFPDRSIFISWFPLPDGERHSAIRRQDHKINELFQPIFVIEKLAAEKHENLKPCVVACCPETLLTHDFTNSRKNEFNQMKETRIIQKSKSFAAIFPDTCKTIT